MAGPCICHSGCPYRIRQNRIYTVYDRLFGDYPAKITVYLYTVFIFVLAKPIHVPQWVSVSDWPEPFMPTVYDCR